MAEMKSLKSQILERLDPPKAKAKEVLNERVAGKGKKGAVAAAAHRGNAMPKVGNKAIYEGKKVQIRSINESGMAVIRFRNNREVIVRLSSLTPDTQDLTEGVLGMAALTPTWKEAPDYGFMKLEGLDPEDIGLIYEEDDDDEPEEKDEQEEDHDNGSNIRQDGHTGKKEIDELPTPSDTIAPAYSDEKAPKEISEPLSIQAGAQEEHLWDEPNWEGYDYPADAPEIPTADFEGEDGGNARPPHYNNDEHQAGDGQEDRESDDGEETEKEDDSEEDERTDESRDEEWGDENVPGKGRWTPKHFQKNKRDTEKTFTKDKPQAVSDFVKKIGEGNVTDPARKKPHKNLGKMRKDIEFTEAYFMAEMDDMLGSGEDNEPKKGDTITLTLPAMASIVCTVASRVGDNEDLLRAMVEALAEVSKGKTIDMPDLEAVAAHINGEELPEIENREAGRPDHEGIEHGEHEGHGEEEHSDHEDSEWPGDGEPTKGGKTKLMADYFGGDDVMEMTRMTEDEEIALLRSRAFPNRVKAHANW